MNIFKNSKLKPRPTVTRVVSAPVSQNPTPASTPLPSRPLKERDTPRSSPSRSRTATPNSERYGSVKPQTKRKASKFKPQVEAPRLYSSEEEEEEEEEDALVNKRQKVEGRPVDIKRRLRSRRAFSSQDGGIFPMIHAADVTVTGKKSRKHQEVAVKGITVELKYPSASQRERYDLDFGKDKIDTPEEVIQIAKIVASFYLTKEQSLPFTEPKNGLIRQLEKASGILNNDPANTQYQTLFKTAVDEYNKALEKLVNKGDLKRNLDDKHQLPFEMVCLMLRQVYDRAVSPNVDLLRKYENGTDNVYGELLPKLISDMLAKTDLRSDQVFVDLGSGVGNVVLQAALEFGCESWGCEMMENACKLAEAQQREFSARCRLWGIATGSVSLEEGDFLENEKIKETMKRADVILVNNQAFTPDLNQRLIDLFLDLKDGCKIVSLKSFVPRGHQITSRNIDNPVNVLDVTEWQYYSNAVSWTDAPGHYFIATKDATRLRKFTKKRI